MIIGIPKEIKNNENRVALNGFICLQYTKKRNRLVFCPSFFILFLVPYKPCPWQFLYFLPLPQGHGSLRPTRFSARTGACFG